MHGTPLNVARKAGIHNGVSAALIGALVGLISLELGFGRFAAHIEFSVWILTCAAAALLLAWRGRFSVVIGVATAALALLLLVASTPITRLLVQPWIRDDHLSPGSNVGAIIVLSSSVKSDSSLDGQGTERLLSGIMAQRLTGAPRLVLTRIESSGADSPASDPGQRALLAIANVPAGWAIIDSVYSTRDEAVRAARLLLPSTRRVAVVTSPMHARRACATFEAVGFEVVCAPAREIANTLRNPASPTDRLVAFGAYTYERLGMLKYRWKGWAR